MLREIRGCFFVNVVCLVVVNVFQIDAMRDGDAVCTFGWVRLDFGERDVRGAEAIVCGSCLDMLGG